MRKDVVFRIDGYRLKNWFAIFCFSLVKIEELVPAMA